MDGNVGGCWPMNVMHLEDDCAINKIPSGWLFGAVPNLACSTGPINQGIDSCVAPP